MRRNRCHWTSIVTSLYSLIAIVIVVRFEDAVRSIVVVVVVWVLMEFLLVDWQRVGILRLTPVRVENRVSWRHVAIVPFGRGIRGSNR